MKLTFVDDSLTPFVKIENTFTDEELDGIWSELDYYCKTKELLPPSHGTGGAKIAEDEGDAYMKNNYGVFMHELWQKPDYSFLMKYSKKLFDEDIVIDISNQNIHMRAYHLSNYDTSLLSYYEDSHYYDMHLDMAQYTIVTWFHKEPKAFDGGEFVFNDSGIEIECTNNTTIIFPSYYYHQVKPIKMNQQFDEKMHGYGRFTLSQWAFCLPTSGL